MKPVSIAVACLLLGGGGLALLGVLPHPSDVPERYAGPSTSRLKTAAGRIPLPVSPAEGRTSGTDVQPSSRPDGETAPRPAPLPRTGAKREDMDSQAVAGVAMPMAAPSSFLPTANAAERPSPIHSEASPNPDLVDSAQVARGGAGPPISVPLSPLDPTVAATIPAVLAEISADSGLNETELAGVAKLAEEFVAKVTSGSQHPQDPAHQQRWAEAQAESDTRMRARYGGHAWLKHHQEAYRQALGNIPAQPER